MVLMELGRELLFDVFLIYLNGEYYDMFFFFVGVSVFVYDYILNLIYIIMIFNMFYYVFWLRVVGFFVLYDLILRSVDLFMEGGGSDVEEGVREFG